MDNAPNTDLPIENPKWEPCLAMSKPALVISLGSLILCARTHTFFEMDFQFPSRVPKVSLNQVTLVVRDVGVNKLFFQRIPGFNLIVDAPPHYARFELSGGNPPSTFSFDLDESAAGQQQTKSSAQLFFELSSREELDEYCAHLESVGFEFLERSTDREYLWREARLKTPENHDVRFYYAGGMRLNSPWRV